MSELLPCPFCGGEVELIQVSRPEGIWEIHCFNDNCHADCGQPDKEAVIEAWNTRPAASVPSEIEIMAAINKAGFDLGSVKGLEIARQIRALLTERK